MELVGVILWNLWNNRNGAIFDGPYRDPLSLISLSIAFLNQFNEANSKDKFNKPISLKSRLSIGHWIRPNAGFVKANFDGAVFMDDKSSGVGVIIRDDKGSFIAGLSKKNLGILEPNVVESYAAKHAIQLLHDLGFNKIVLEGDSQKVIKMLDRLESNDSSCGLLIDDTIVLCQDFMCWEVSWISRSFNVPTHTLAKYAVNLLDSYI
ncbi:uncharacterized protein LOC113777063 [Coffea eugenioides]|uniref:uncharacterized protein LOC113755740 n=1 Tax=Coffea eugenioides TaxID=49369 RepID=UPI000F613138|nr:uncharacterized protein LOC113755740 [Coffea eugenioides]XP_027177909.1 uncharacterized protein LOC113777063 [Coffea eugenioides]